MTVSPPSKSSFRPTETFSRLGKPPLALTKKLGECALAGGVVFKDGFVVNALRKLTVGLCKGNHALYKRSLYGSARMIGNAFCADANTPTSERKI